MITLTVDAIIAKGIVCLGFILIIGYLLKNKWIKFDIVKGYYPSENGWYQCTVEVPGQQRYVMDLYWYEKEKWWIDNRRQNVFDDYQVMAYKNGQIAEGLYQKETDHLVNRTANVIAYRDIPKAYMRGFKKNNEVF